MERNVTVNLELCRRRDGTTDMTDAEVMRRWPAFVQKMQNQLDKEIESEFHIKPDPEILCGVV